jgi:hypothetical protein
MDIDLKKKNKLDLKPFIKVIKVFSILGVVIAIAGLSISPLIDKKDVEIVEDKAEGKTSQLTPASYTIIMGQNEDEVIIKFHNQNSELHLKKIDVDQHNCLLNGGGVNCVLKKAYQAKTEVIEKEAESIPKAQIEKKFSGIKINKNLMDNLVVVLGIFLFFFLINKFTNK